MGGYRSLIAKALIGVLLFLLLSLSVAHAATLTVNSNADDNDGVWGNGHDTLREAIAHSTSGDTINFNLTYPATITLGMELFLT